jgi:hypothetical protein
MGIKRFDVFGRMQANEHFRLILKEFRNGLKMREGREKCIKFLRCDYISVYRTMSVREAAIFPQFFNQNN